MKPYDRTLSIAALIVILMTFIIMTVGYFKLLYLHDLIMYWPIPIMGFYCGAGVTIVIYKITKKKHS